MLLLTVGARAADVEVLPRAVAGATTSNYGGIAVADPYRALEDNGIESTRSWIDAHARHARRVLDALPARQKVRDEYEAIDAEQPPTLTGVRSTRQGASLYIKHERGERSARLFISWNGVERPLFIDAAADRGTVVDFAVSDDGRQVAVISRDESGAVLQVSDVATGRAMGARINDVWPGAAPLFSGNGRSLIYVARVDAGDALHLQLREQRFVDGTTRTLMGWNAGHGPALGENEFVSVKRSAGRLYAVIRRGSTGPLRVWSTPFEALQRDPACASWTKLFDETAKVRTISVRGDLVFTTTSSAAPRYRIVRYDARHPAALPVEVVAERPGVIEGIMAAGDGLYYTVREGYEFALYRRAYEGRSTIRSALPFAGSAVLVDADATRPGVIASLEGWNRRKRYVRAVGLAQTDLGLVSTESRIGGDWAVDEVPCATADPRQSPMVVIYRKGLVRDGSHPLLINGYGAYGYLEAPYFFPKLDAWLRRGGIFVDVTPRGGGGTGETSHQAAMGATKPNTWKDVIACAETLVARGYTSPAHLGIQGTGIGGVMAGRAITERPDLFATAVIRSGITDTLRYIESPAHAEADEGELGDLDTVDGVRSLLAASTYHHIENGVRYPALLLTTGMKDRRFAPWMSFKTAARFAAVGVDRPVLLRVDYDAALGPDTSMAQRNDEAADRLAFVLWSLGVPEPGP